MAANIRRLNPTGLGRPRAPFTQTTVIPSAGLLFVSGLAPIDEDRNMIGATITDQTRAVYAKLKTALAAHGATFSDLAKITIYLRDPEDIDEFNRVPGEFYEADEYPAATLVAGVRLVDPSWRVEIEAIAALRSESG